ncbi:MAG: molecular chaperone DnaJ [Rickettsia sp.]|nr:molecular chaperone DnaJ [Rickettsia sp.]
MSQDYYSVLGVDRSASASEIKKAYLKLAKKHHPDHNNGSSIAEKKFKEVSEAYDVLKDEQKRAAYDRFGHDSFKQGAGQQSSSGFGSSAGASFHDMGDVFSDFFGDFMGGGRRSQKTSSSYRGSDLKYNLQITLEEAFLGIDKKIKFRSHVKCSNCSGSGSEGQSSMVNCNFCHGTGVNNIQQGFFSISQTCSHCKGAGKIIKNPCKSCRGIGRLEKNRELIVKIPSGVENGMNIRLTNEGEAGVRGGTNGDLYVIAHILPHSIFDVQNHIDLHCRLDINFTKAILGGEVDVKTLDKKTIQLKIPPYTAQNYKLRVAGKGMSKIRSSNRGDLYAHVNIIIPQSISKKQKDLLLELDKDLNNGKSDGFFSKLRNSFK